MQTLWLLLNIALGYVAGVTLVYSLTGNVRHIRRYEAWRASGRAGCAGHHVLGASWLVAPHRVLMLIPATFVVGYLLRTRAFLRSEDTRGMLPPHTWRKEPGGQGIHSSHLPGAWRA